MRRFGWLVCAASLLCGTARPAAIPEYPFVFVTGRADTEVPPDIAACSLTVRAFDADAATAQTVVERRSDAILDLLAARHIARGDIRAYDVTKEAVTTEGSPQQPLAIRGYRISRRISFLVRRVGDWPAIARALLGAPNIDDLGIRFDLSDRSSVESQLLAKAAKDAATRARALAASFGRPLGAPVAISQAPFESIGPAFGFGGGYGYAAPQFRIAQSRAQDAIPATIEISASVNAIFKLQ